MGMLKFIRLRVLHRWIGIIAIVPLVLVSLSGAILVYQKPLVRWTVAQSATLPIHYTQASVIAQLDDVVRLAQLRSAARIKAPNSTEPYWTITDQSENHTLYSVSSLAQYDSNNWILDVLWVVRHLHTSLLTETVGKWMLLVSGIFALFLSISGVVLWWPGKRGFRWRFVRPRAVNPRIALQLHRHSGIVAFVPLFIVLLTGALMMWQKLIFPILAPLPAETALTAKSLNWQGKLSASQALTHAQQLLPQAWPTYIRVPDAETPKYQFRFRLPGEWHINGRTRVYIDGISHNAQMTQRADQLPWQYRLVNQLYPFHSAYGMPAFYSVLTLLTGWFLFHLSYTGLISYGKRLLQR